MFVCVGGLRPFIKMSSCSASLIELGWEREPDGGKKTQPNPGAAYGCCSDSLAEENTKLERIKRLNMLAYLFK